MGLPVFIATVRAELLKIPAQFHLEAMVVVGRPGARDLLSEALLARETPSDRRPLAQTVV